MIVWWCLILSLGPLSWLRMGKASPGTTGDVRKAEVLHTRLLAV